MEMHALLEDTMAFAGGGLLLLVLGWAALERGAAHRLWQAMRRGRDSSVQWGLAMGTAVTCV